MASLVRTYRSINTKRGGGANFKATTVNPQYHWKVLQTLVLGSLDVDRETILGLLVDILCERKSFNEADSFSNLANVWCEDRWC